MSERRACSIVGADRSTIRYRSRRSDVALPRGRLREPATERRRFGYRRLHVVVPRGPCREPRADPATVPGGRPVGSPSPLSKAGLRNPRADGRRGSAERSLAARLRARSDGVRSAVPGARRHRRRDQAVPRGHPRHVDLGQAGRPRADDARRQVWQAEARRQRRRHRAEGRRSRFTSNAILLWAKQTGVEWHSIASGRPMQNGIFEAFDGRMRDELLDETLFRDLDHARSAVARQVVDYNDHRSHSALGYLTPRAFASTFTATDDRRSWPGLGSRSSVAHPAHRRQLTRGLRPRLDDRRGSQHRFESPTKLPNVRTMLRRQAHASRTRRRHRRRRLWLPLGTRQCDSACLRREAATNPKAPF